MNIRSELSVRLGSEITRKNSNPVRISERTNQPIEVVQGYLDGNREIKFDELRPICESMNIGLMWLLSPNYKKSHLIFRSIGDLDLNRVSRIENAFLVIGSILPIVDKFPAPQLNTSENDTGMLLAEINAVLSTLRQNYSTVEDLYESTHLPILPVSAGEKGFDAFIMNSGKHSVVCVNRNKPPARILFSLLHEMAHFLWHRETDVQVDVSLFEANENISVANIPEYVANKFAQQFIFHLNEVKDFARNWRAIPNIAQIISERRTTPDVLAFAIHDYLKLINKPTQYAQIRDELKAQAGTGWGSDKSILNFIEQRGNELKQIIKKNREEFSESVWLEINDAWELDID